MKTFDAFRKDSLRKRIVRSEYARLAEEFAEARKRIVGMRKDASRDKSRLPGPRS